MPGESRAQRQAALEERRRRIAEIRQARSRRDQDTSTRPSTSNLDEYVSELLNEPAPAVVGAAVEETEASQVVVEKTAAAEETNGDKQQSQVSNGAAAPVAPPPKVETFTVATQTEVEDFTEEPETAEAAAVVEEVVEQPQADDAQLQKDSLEPKVLTSEQVEKEVSSTPFSSFLNTASKKVERVLGQQAMMNDLLVDSVDSVGKDREPVESNAAQKYITSRVAYTCPKWTAGRDITDMDWSPLARELVLSTHYLNSTAGSPQASTPNTTHRDASSASLTPRSGELQSDGLALIWSLTMPHRPEHVFTVGSPVTAGKFHPTAPNLIVGGCANGQVVVWDVRAGRLPVQKSALLAGTKGHHSHAINCMQVVQGGAAMVTSSTDGKVNFWSLSNLVEPAETIQVGDSVSCLAMAPESDTLMLGDEHGGLWSAAMGQRRRVVKKLEMDDDASHYGMVTALSCQSGFMLSSGVDWTVKLWNSNTTTLLTSLVCHSYDYMSDVQWNPVHTSVFCTASSNGRVGLWNLATSLDEPVANVSVNDNDKGISKLRWSVDGRRLAVASGDVLHVMAMESDAADDANKMMNQFTARGWASRQ